MSGIGQGQASPLLLVHLVCGILRTLDAPILRLPQALVHTRDVLSSQSRTVRIRFSSRSMSWMLERMLCSNKRYNITLRFPLYPITSIQQKRSNNYLFFSTAILLSPLLNWRRARLSLAGAKGIDSLQSNAPMPNLVARADQPRRDLAPGAWTGSLGAEDWRSRVV